MLLGIGAHAAWTDVHRGGRGALLENQTGNINQ